MKTDARQNTLARLFPFVSWLKGYRLSYLRSDVIAGITVGIILVPQSMAYAMLAGLPPVYGLYAALVTPWIASLFGSLRELATGPIAIMSLLVMTTLSPIAEPFSQRFIELAGLLSLMVGAFYFSIGIFRAGEIMRFVSNSAVTGFTSAAALIIIATQIPSLIGISSGSHEFILPRLLEIISKLHTAHLPTLLTGISAFLIIYGVSRYKKAWPAGLISLVITTAAVVVFELHQSGVAVVGKSAAGLPHFSYPGIDLEIMGDLAGPALVMAIVSFAETYSVSKAVSAETGQKVDVNQEFIGQGLANLAGSFFQSFPVSGSFSRTAINHSAGAKTGLSSIVSSGLVLAALIFLMPYLAYIPKAALAALVTSAVLNLFHPKAVFAIYRAHRHDGIVAISVFVLSLLTKPDFALLFGVLLSLVLFMNKTMHPRIVIETMDPDLKLFVNAEMLKLPICPQLLQIRLDAPLFFANAEYLVDRVEEILKRMDDHLKFLLLDMQVVGFIDFTGIAALESLAKKIHDRGMKMALTGLHAPVIEALKRAGFTDTVEEKLLLPHRQQAISGLFNLIDHAYCREACHLRLFDECPPKTGEADDKKGS